MYARVIQRTSGVPTVLDLPASPLFELFAIGVIGLVALLGIALVLSNLRRRHVERAGEIAPEVLQRWRADLVESVGKASQTQGAHITLRGFWRHAGLSNPQKYVVLKDLLHRQVFYPAYSSDQLIAFFQQVRWNYLHFPVSCVRLSDQNWQRLASGAQAGIVANGDVILVQHSPGAGVNSRSPGARQTISQDCTPADVTQLVAALRQDSESLVPGHPLRQRAESLADTLERDSAFGRAESVKKTAADVLEFASNSAGLWAATLAILSAFTS